MRATADILRLPQDVRHKALTYGIGALVSKDTFSDGDWKITATFAPTLLSKRAESTRQQLTQWDSQGVTTEEREA